MSILATLSTVSLGHYIALGGMISFPAATVLPLRYKERRKAYDVFLLAASISLNVVAIGFVLHLGAHPSLFAGFVALFAVVASLASALGSYLAVKRGLRQSGRKASLWERILAWGTVLSMLAVVACVIAIFV